MVAEGDATRGCSDIDTAKATFSLYQLRKDGDVCATVVQQISRSALPAAIHLDQSTTNEHARHAATFRRAGTKLKTRAHAGMPTSFPLADSSPEDRELAFRIRELGGLLPCGEAVDWAGLRGRCGDVFRGIIRESAESRRLTELVAGQPYLVGGDEHHIIRVESDPERVYKVTHGDNFGCRSYFSPEDPELRGNFHGTTNADPFFYLNRWRLLNAMGGFKTRLEGFVPAEKPGWLPRICISQPELPQGNPTAGEIRAALEKFGLFEVSEAAFFNPESRLLLTDAAPRNVRVIEGIPVPFDAIAQIASGRMLAWCNAKCGL